MERPENNIYDGCEFDENQNIDWDALEITEELALQIGGPIITSPTLGGMNNSSKKHLRDVRCEDDDESENIKFMRFGSLGRIIASSVVASTPPASSESKVPLFVSPPDDAQRRDAIKFTASRFIAAFNIGDMGRLALLVRELCDESCLLITPDVDSRDYIVGRADVMMLFSLILETFPDGVYRTLSSTVDCGHVSIIYSFTGTRVFEQSLDSLYKQCRMHAAVGSVDGTINSNTNPESFSCELDLIQISKTTTQNSVSIDLHPKSSFPSSSEKLQNCSSQVTFQQSQHNNDHSHSHSHSHNHHYNPFHTLQHRFSESVSSIMPHAGRLASDALKEGPIKRKRSMEMYFNATNQIVKIIFVDMATALR